MSPLEAIQTRPDFRGSPTFASGCIFRRHAATKSRGCIHVAGRVVRMPALKGRTPRRLDEPMVVLQARVAPASRAKAHDAARALGVSVAAYVERLIQQDQLDEAGRPTWWPDDDGDTPQTELPLAM